MLFKNWNDEAFNSSSNHFIISYLPLTLYVFPTRLHVHQRMNANGTITKWFIFLKQSSNEYNVTEDIYTLSSCWLCTLTHSVHACILKPWRGRLPSAFSSYHIFSPLLSGLNWLSLTPTGGPGPSTSKMAALPTGSAHTPLLGSRTVWVHAERSIQQSRCSNTYVKAKTMI
jgi:hypothetical protein